MRTEISSLCWGLWCYSCDCKPKNCWLNVNLYTDSKLHASGPGNIKNRINSFMAETYDIETSPWTGFYMIKASIMKELSWASTNF